MKHASRSFCILHSAFCIAIAALAASAAFADLPAGYAQVEYVEATGAQYIDTGVTPNQNTRVVVDIAYTTATAAGGGFGYAASGSKHSFRFWRTMTDGVATYRVNINNSYNTANDFPTTFADDTARHLVDISNASKKIDGVAFGDTSGLTQAVAGTMYLFAIHNGWKDSNNRYVGSWGYYRIYSCQIYSGQTLARDFVPCVDSNGKAGLYDVANGKMYYNGGSGADLVAAPNSERLWVSGASPAGTPVDFAETIPANGVVSGLAVGDSFICTAPAVCTNAASDTAATCVGYKVYTNNFVYMQGETTNFTYVHPVATLIQLVWQYAPEYKVTATAGAGGVVSPAEQWVAEGAPVTVTATPDPTHSFSKWNGDVPTGASSSAPVLTFAADSPRALTASFGTAPSAFYVSTNDLQEIGGTVWGTYVTDDGVPHAAYTNLQTAINYAVNNKKGSTIWVEDGFTVSTGSALYENSATRITCSSWNSKLTIRSRSGDWRTGAEIRGNATTRCFGGQSDTFIGFRFVSGTATNGNGGCMLVGQYGGTFENCLLADGKAQGSGGGASCTSTSTTFRNCVITNCATVNGNGGGIYNATCYDCLFIGNRAIGTSWSAGRGGGICNAGNSPGGTVSNCVFVSNHAYNKSQIDHASRQAGTGGAIDYVGSIKDCVFSNCTASASGGAIARSTGGRNVTVVNCQAGRGGGGIRGGAWVGGSIIGCVDTNTTAHTDTNGGGVSYDAVVTDFLIAGNRSLHYGGGANKTTLTNCVVILNVASNISAKSGAIIAGGGVYGGRAVNCVIANNIACGPAAQKGANYYGSGGGAYNTTLIKCLVTNNVAWYRGGGTFGGTAWNCQITDNESFAEGGGSAATTPVFNTLIARNKATQQAGVWTDSKATTVLVNSTVTANENTVAGQSAVYRAAITNSVVWGNLGEGVSQTASRIGAANSCYPEANGVNGTTSRNPNLADVEGKTFVATASCCRRKGILYDWMDNGSIRSTDWYGAPRVYQNRPDMGWVSVLPPPRHSVIYLQ